MEWTELEREKKKLSSIIIQKLKLPMIVEGGEQKYAPTYILARM